MTALAAHRRRPRAIVVAATAVTVLFAACSPGGAPGRAPLPGGGQVITGPYASLLAASENFGPSRAEDAQLTVTLAGNGQPEGLIGWAARQGLAVRWHAGAAWAVVAGPAQRLAAAFDVPVHDYQGRQGQRYYASPEQPEVPASLRADVTGVGRILSYLPHRNARPVLALDVPRLGLTPPDLLRAYNAKALADDGYRGLGQTVVIFAFDGFEQRDLDAFADISGLPRFTPEVVGGPLGPVQGETVMDAEIVHAIAPDARIVVINARRTVEGGGGFEKIAAMFDDAARDYPNSVWSLSIGWGCEALVTAADVAPVRAALANAHRRGITVFDASGDNAGLECKGGKDWSAPPGPEHIGVDTIASLPEMTSVGGTTLSTDVQGRWMEEWGWIDPPLSEGSSGGISMLSKRPAYQNWLPADVLALDRPGVTGRGEHRLVPDVSAVADPFTGVRIVLNQALMTGGGTSQAAPVWAGITALMNEYVVDNGGRPLGDINPLLYRIAQGSRLPGFRDIIEGGNAVDNPKRGYDLVAGLGSPNVDNLARDLLDAQRAQLAAGDFLSSGG